MIKERNFKFNIILLSISIVFLFFFNTDATLSVEPDEILQDEKMEIRARNISKNIRCMICQNQSIDESSAMMARDLRLIIRDKIVHGNSDEEIYKFLTDRYGDFILLKPSFNLTNAPLWILPFIFLLFGFLFVFFRSKKN